MERQRARLQGLWSEDRISMMRRVDDVVACLGPASPCAVARESSVLGSGVDPDPALVRLACVSLASRLFEDDPLRARVLRGVHQWFDKVAEDGSSQREISSIGDAVASSIVAQAIDSELHKRGFASDPEIPCTASSSRQG